MSVEHAHGFTCPCMLRSICERTFASGMHFVALSASTVTILRTPFTHGVNSGTYSDREQAQDATLVPMVWGPVHVAPGFKVSVTFLPNTTVGVGAVVAGIVVSVSFSRGSMSADGGIVGTGDVGCEDIGVAFVGCVNATCVCAPSGSVIRGGPAVAAIVVVGISGQGVLLGSFVGSVWPPRGATVSSRRRRFGTVMPISSHTPYTG